MRSTLEASRAHFRFGVSEIASKLGTKKEIDRSRWVYARTRGQTQRKGDLAKYGSDTVKAVLRNEDPMAAEVGGLKTEGR